jgi:hypothetical protein
MFVFVSLSLIKVDPIVFTKGHDDSCIIQSYSLDMLLQVYMKEGEQQR